MTTYELYINDILCDPSSDEVITLLYQSPIFSKLDSIQSNRSYNIALPPTPTNIRAVGFAERPDVDSDVPYIRNSAALYQDGVPLFTQGFAVVTDISDTINVTLTWGNADNFQPLFDSNLRDLGPQLEEAGESHIDWNENTELLDATGEEPAVAFWGINFGMGLSNPKYLHPSVPVSAILEYIEKYNGVTIDGKDRLAYSPNMGPIIPLVSKNGDEVSGKAETTVCRLSQATSNGQTILKGTNPTQHPEYVNGDYFDVKNAQGIDMQMTISGFLFSSDIKDMEGLNIYVAPSDDYDTRIANIAVGGINQDDRIYIYGTPHVEVPQDKIPESGYVVIVIKHEKRVDLGGDMRFFAYPRSEVYFPSVFPIAPNLPDMSQGDFVLSLMSMNGLFAYADKDSPNTIKLISIDDIIANVEKNDIIDWSDRVILNEIHRVDMPDSSAFTIDDLAQSNILDYDNDDDVKTDTHGTITIRNENIEKETDLVSLPFSASENANTAGLDQPCALVPIYEDDGKGGANYSEVSPRILSARGMYYNTIDIKSIGVFDPWMKFGGENGIVKTQYASYQKVVDRLRIITVRAKLTALDLYNLDYTKPVYIAQFGQLFAIYSVETGEDGICDCQLLKLKVDGVVPVGYYLTLNGSAGDISVDVMVDGGQTDITYNTNGTLQILSYSGDAVRNAVISGSVISIYSGLNTSSEQRAGQVIVTLKESPRIKRTITVVQAGAVTPTLKLDFDEAMPWAATRHTVGIINTSDIDIKVWSLPSWFISVHTPFTIEQGRTYRMGIYENDSEDTRTGIIDIRDEYGRYKTDVEVSQKGVTSYDPSVSFSETLPWSTYDAPITMTNNGNVDLEVISIPDWFLYTGVPHDLPQGEIFAFGISQNTTGELRSGTVGMRYQNAMGQYVDYNVEVSQKGTNARMVIIDASIDPSLAGQDVIASFEVVGDGATGEGSVQIADNNTIRLTFEQVSSYLGIEGIEYCGGDTLRVMLPDYGYLGDGIIPEETGDVHIVLN